MANKNKKNKKNKKHAPQKSIGFFDSIRIIFVSIVFVAVIADMIYSCIGERKLKNNHKVVMGVVYDTGSTRRTRKVRHYHFLVNGDKFRGMSSYDEELEIHDPIKVVYYPDDPNINQSWNTYIRMTK